MPGAVSVFVLCTGIWFAGAHLTQAQEATSANLPDQFQTGEMIQIHKPKKKKGGASSKTVATAAKQETAPVPEEMPAVEEDANTDRAGDRKESRAQPEHCLNATKSKTSDSDPTGAFCGRAGSNRRACRKETSAEKTAATRSCGATGGAEHFGARSNVAFSGAIHGNQRTPA